MRITFKQYDKLLPLKELKPSKHQRNKHPQEQIERLAKIMREHGVRHPIHISSLSGQVCFGHGRWEAAKLNKFTQYPVVYQEFKDDKEEYACVQSDNAISFWAELDQAAILRDLPHLGEDFDIELLGIKDFKLPKDPIEPGCDEDEVPDKVETRAKLGDRWLLGDHVLVCGDSTDVCAVDLLMMGEKADMVFTDPPYGMNLNTSYADTLGPGKSFKREIKNYKPVAGDDHEFDFMQSYALVESIDEQFWWGADYYCDKIPKNGSWIVWDKKTNENLQKMYGSDFELCWSKQKHSREIARITWAGVLGHSKKDDGATKTHPTMKAVKLIEWFFERFKGEKIIDLFGGSGSTLIACEKTNRKCYMMEIDPHYCDVILKRWETYTGKKAELQNGQTKEEHKRGTSNSTRRDKLLIRRNGSGPRL